MTLLCFLISSNAFQHTINTEEKMTMVAVSSAVCKGSAAGTWKEESCSLLLQSRQESKKREKLIQLARLSSFGVDIVISRS